MIHKLLIWAYARLELVIGTITGATTVVLAESIIFKFILSIVLGFAGAMGASIWKWVVEKYKAFNNHP